MKPWQAFERLVADIEEHFQGADAEVVRNAVIFDSKNHPTKVEVAVRARAGETDLLILLECRNRLRKPGRPWIDELKGRRDRLRAAKVIAIANLPLTKPGADWAKEHGIEFRLLSKLDAVKAETLFPSFAVTAIVTGWTGIKVLVDFETPEERSAFADSMTKSPIDFNTASFFRATPDEPLQSATSMYHRAKREDPAAFPKEVGQHPVSFTFESPSNQLEVVASNWSARAKSVVIEYDYLVEETVCRSPTVHAYDFAKGEPVLYTIEHELTTSHVDLRSMIIANRDDCQPG